MVRRVKFTYNLCLTTATCSDTTAICVCGAGQFGDGVTSCTRESSCLAAPHMCARARGRASKSLLTEWPQCARSIAYGIDSLQFMRRRQRVYQHGVCPVRAPSNIRGCTGRPRSHLQICMHTPSGRYRCAVNTYSSVAASPSCTSCPSISTTNGLTGTTTCSCPSGGSATAVGGYYGNGLLGANLVCFCTWDACTPRAGNAHQACPISSCR